MYDVGQGDAILLKFEGGEKVLVDGGADFEVDRHLSLESVFNTCHLDAIVLTHPHQDHIKGLNRILERCKVDKIYYNRTDYESREHARWIEFMNDFKVVDVYAGDSLSFGDAQINFIWPRTPSDLKTDNINNTSIGFVLNYKDESALFLGDLEKEALQKIDYAEVEAIVGDFLEILKVPHHGGESSFVGELVNLKPRRCIVSVGEENRYNHPHQNVIDRYSDSGCAVECTDEVGTIEVSLK